MAAIPWFFGLFACYFIGRAANTVLRRRIWEDRAVPLHRTLHLRLRPGRRHQRSSPGHHLHHPGRLQLPSIGPIAWSFQTAFLIGTAAAAGIGLINSLGSIGGFVAPILQTSVNEISASETGTMGIYALGVLPFVAAATMLGTRRFKNKADELLEQ